MAGMLFSNISGTENAVVLIRHGSFFHCFVTLLSQLSNRVRIFWNGMNEKRQKKWPDDLFCAAHEIRINGGKLS